MLKQEKQIRKRYILLITYAIVLYVVAVHFTSVYNGLLYISQGLTSIWLGLFFALLINVPFRGYEKIFNNNKHFTKMSLKSRTTCSFVLALITTIVTIYMIISYVVPQFINAVTDAVDLFKNNSDTIVASAEKIGIDEATVNTVLSKIMNWINANVMEITNFAFSTVMSVYSIVIDVILAIIFSIYFLIDKNNVTKGSKKLLNAIFPENVAATLIKAGNMFVSTFSIFFTKQCLEALILGGMLFVAMLILQLPYALPIAYLTAVLALIPFVGAFCSFFLGTCMLVLIDPSKTLIFMVCFLVVQQIEGNIIFPKVVGGSVGLPAYLTLASVVIGGALFGVLGMFLIIPIVSVLHCLGAEWVQETLKRKAIEKELL